MKNQDFYLKNITCLRSFSPPLLSPGFGFYHIEDIEWHVKEMYTEATQTLLYNLFFKIGPIFAQV